MRGYQKLQREILNRKKKDDAKKNEGGKGRRENCQVMEHNNSQGS